MFPLQLAPCAVMALTSPNGLCDRSDANDQEATVSYLDHGQKVSICRRKAKGLGDSLGRNYRKWTTLLPVRWSANCMIRALARSVEGWPYSFSTKEPSSWPICNPMSHGRAPSSKR